MWLKAGTYHRESVNDPERCEYFVPMRWLQTVPLEKAVKEIGLFGNQNSVCKPTTHLRTTGSFRGKKEATLEYSTQEARTSCPAPLRRGP
jgi:hypothetical protein